MSVTPEDKDNLNDHDLAELFANDSLEPPAALDADILEQARAAHHADVHKAPTQSRPNKIAPMFATAAVLLLAVVLVPLMVGQDDVSQDTYAPTAIGLNKKPADDTAYGEGMVSSAVNSESARIVLQASETAEPDAGTRPADNVGNQFSRPAAQSRLVAPQAAPQPEAMAEESVPKISARAVAIHPDNKSSDDRQKKERTNLSADREVAASAASDEDNSPYRLTPAKWIEEILHLFDGGKTQNARAELEKFITKHPDNELLKRLPSALLSDTAK